MKRKIKTLITLTGLFTLVTIPALVTVNQIIKTNAETTTYITNGSATSYKINYFSNQSTANLVAKDVQSFINESTGATMPLNVLNDSNKIDGIEYMTIATSNYVPTGLSRSVFHKLASYKIENQNGNIVIYAPSKYGLYNGVYAFLNSAIGLNIFTGDCYTLSSKSSILLSSIKFGLDEPNFDYSIPMSGLAKKYAASRIRLGQVDIYDQITGAGIGAPVFHNFKTIISEAEFGSSHPDWFSNDQLNLSYNNYEMVDYVVEKVKAKLISDNFSHKYYTFTQEDREQWSNSSTSLALYNQYGCYSAEYIIFMNKCAQKLDTWAKANYPTKQFELTMFAYHTTITAPATYNATTGKYEPKSQDVVFYEGDNCSLGLIYAPISSNIYLPLQNQQKLVESNGAPHEFSGDYMPYWGALTNHINYWTYSTYFDDYLAPTAVITNMQKNYQWAYQNGNGFYLYQGQHNEPLGTNFADLTNYLQAKLARNVNISYQKEINRFISAYYGPAKTAMRAYFDAIENHYSWINSNFSEFATKFGCSTNRYGLSLVQQKYFPKANLEQYLENIFTAYAALMKSLNNGEITQSEYEIYHDRCERESISCRYMLRRLYCRDNEPNDWDESTSSFYKTCQNLGMTQKSESATF